MATRWTPSDAYCVRRNTYSRWPQEVHPTIDGDKHSSYTAFPFHIVLHVSHHNMNPGGTSSYRDGHRRDTLLYYVYLLAHAIGGGEGYILLLCMQTYGTYQIIPYMWPSQAGGSFSFFPLPTRPWPRRATRTILRSRGRGTRRASGAATRARARTRRARARTRASSWTSGYLTKTIQPGKYRFTIVHNGFTHKAFNNAFKRPSPQAMQLLRASGLHQEVPVREQEMRWALSIHERGVLHCALLHITLELAFCMAWSMAWRGMYSD